VITRDPSQLARVFYAYGTTGVFENVSILNGASPQFGANDGGNPLAWGFGGGLYLQNCDFTFSNCTVAGNVLTKGWDMGKGYAWRVYVNSGG